MSRRFVTVVTAALIVLTASDTSAQAKFGGQVSWGDDSDFGLGGRAAVDVAQAPLEVSGTFDFFFPDEPPGTELTYWEINGNLSYLIDIPEAPSLIPYLGAGLNIAHASLDFDDVSPRDGSETDAGLNLLGGMRFETTAYVLPFIELRLELGGGEQFVVSGGLIFF